ncbi:MAG: TetR/AcrR family transcriptional regulator [Oceanococcaceae bacterium]
MKASSLTAKDWAQAALDAITRGGVAAVSVEAIARDLNVTKGSFYWHFRNRAALLGAAMELWEKKETDDIIALADAITDPRKRIQEVFRAATSSAGAGRLMLALAAASDSEEIGNFVQRATHRRLTFLTDCYRALGQSADDAQRWATFAYSTFIGSLQLFRDNPDAVPAQDMTEYLRLCISTLIPRQAGGATSVAA